MEIDTITASTTIREFRVTCDGVGTYDGIAWRFDETITRVREWLITHVPFPKDRVCKAHTIVDFKPIPILYGGRVVSDLHVEMAPTARIHRGTMCTYATVHYDPRITCRVDIPTIDMPGVVWDPVSTRDEYIVAFDVHEAGPLRRELRIRLIYVCDSSAVQHCIDTYQPILKRILAYHDTHATRMDNMWRIKARMHDHAIEDDLLYIKNHLESQHVAMTCKGRDVSIDARLSDESETFVRDHVIPRLKTRLRIHDMVIYNYWRFEVKSSRSDVMFAIMQALDDRKSYYRQHTHDVVMQIPSYVITGYVVDWGYIANTKHTNEIELHPTLGIPFAQTINHLRFKIERVSDSVIMEIDLKYPIMRETHIRGVYDLIERIAHDTSPSSAEVKDVQSKIEAFRLR